MKYIKIVLAASIAMIGIYSCTDDENIRVHSDTIVGKWRLVGTQVSPGYPVPISPVPLFPVNMLEFKSDSTVISSFSSMPVLYYSIHEDTVFRMKGLFLYSALERTKASAQGVYRFSISDDTLRLGSMGCYEVCDEIFKRVN